MGVIYTRDRDGNLKQAKTVRVIGAGPAEKIEYKAIAQEQSVTVSGTGEAYGEIISTEPLEAGKTYLVKFEGKEYQCTAYHPTDEYGEVLATITAIGTFLYAAYQIYPGWKGLSNGEPFAVTTDEAVSGMCLFTEKNGTYNISISKIVKTSSTGSGEGLDTSVTEFNQMNDNVVAYLAAADAAYTDDNGGESIIRTDDNTGGTIEPGFADRPLGLTVASQAGTFYLQNEGSAGGWKEEAKAESHTIYNAVPGVVSQYLIKDATGNLLANGRIKPTGKVRMLHFVWDARNSRDLGGWDCDGGTIKYGKLFRGASVGNNDYQTENEAIAKAIGIRRQVDFRGDEEAQYKTASHFGESVRYERITLNEYYQDTIEIGGGDYTNAKKVFRTIFDAVLHNEPLYFNCSLGRDRTGTIAFMILALLGVARRNIEKEYELSSFSSLSEWEGKTIPAKRTSLASMVTYLSSFGGTTLRDNAVWWFLKAGFTLNELDAFRAAMIDGTPGKLSRTDFPDNHAVTNTLVFCENSNGATFITDGKSYTASLTPDSGHELVSVTVTMGGEDVTATYYENGNINIPAVTGDIVVTAIAKFVFDGTNLVETATTVPYGTEIYNGVGYCNGKYISGVETVSYSNDAACVATGSIPVTVTYYDFPTVYIRGITIDLALNGHCRFYFASSEGRVQTNNMFDEPAKYTFTRLADQYYKLEPVIGGDGKAVMCNYVGKGDISFRISGVGRGESLIVTIDEPIE